MCWNWKWGFGVCLSLWLKYIKTYQIYYIQCATADPDGQKRALVVGGGIANFTDVAATFNGIIRAMKEKVSFFFIQK